MALTDLKLSVLGEFDNQPERDYWIIACLPDGEAAVYLQKSPDVEAVDLLPNNDWEEDGIRVPSDLAPGVYKLKLTVTGGRDNCDGEYWHEIGVQVLETLWLLNAEGESHD